MRRLGARGPERGSVDRMPTADGKRKTTNEYYNYNFFSIIIIINTTASTVKQIELRTGGTRVQRPDVVRTGIAHKGGGGGGGEKNDRRG